VWLLLIGCARASAEQLPARTYMTADGLLSNNVNRIVPDARGFIWFCTPEGLSRFDGYSFTNYTTDDGLPDRHVNDLLVTRGGDYWLATEGGLVRFDPRGLRPHDRGPAAAARAPSGAGLGSAGPMFTVVRLGDEPKPNTVNVLFEDGAGTLWVGTDAGLFRSAGRAGQARFDPVALRQAGDAAGADSVVAVCADGRGALWAGTPAGLFRLLPDGRVEHYTKQQGLPINDIRALLKDRAGRVWAGTGGGGGLLLLDSDPAPGRSIVSRFYSRREGLPSDWVMSLYQSADGRVLAGTPYGLAQLVDDAVTGASAFRVYGEGQGLCGRDYYAVAEDRDGDLWAASRCGVTKLARYGFTRYTRADGLDSLSINSIFENRAGELFVSTNEKWRAVSRFGGERFVTVRPALPVPEAAYPGWGWKQTVLQDHLGVWWVPHGAGLYRFAPSVRFEQLGRAPASAVGVKRTGTEIFRLYEDTRGDVWIATTGNGTDLMRWERATQVWHDYTRAAGVSAQRIGTAFREDRAGNLWIATGGDDAALLRYRDGQIKAFTHADGVPQGWLKDLYLDHAGRLWIASNVAGLWRVDDPSAERPAFVAYTTADGLSSNNVLCVTEDSWGHIYAGTGRALDRLDPATGRIKHYTSADGLPNGRVEEAWRDRQGALWFGSTVGLARLLPEPERPSQPPLILITGLRVAGVSRPVSALGETDIPPLELAPDETQVSVDFLGLGASLGEELRYEYELEGAGGNWAQTAERTVNFANLAPGAYRLLVRAVNADGVDSPRPATVSLRIAAPVWRRWWFVALCALAAGGLMYLAHRYRIARLLAVANMRTRIATDLHDDIGSGLSRVAILSEVVKQQTGASAPQAEPLLTEIADSARVLVDSMRDIVWAIDPGHDDLASLLARVRQFASDVLEPRKISFDFPAPSEVQKIKLDADQRRHLHLIFKEAINNIARHADCTSVALGVRIVDNRLTAELQDDGRGFNISPEAAANGRGGHGLENMRRRVAQLDGQLKVESEPGRGTRLRLSVALK
jgi:signal transduction histidine kinase/streptogramin lyase